VLLSCLSGLGETTPRCCKSGVSQLSSPSQRLECLQSTSVPASGRRGDDKKLPTATFHQESVAACCSPDKHCQASAATLISWADPTRWRIPGSHQRNVGDDLTLLAVSFDFLPKNGTKIFYRETSPAVLTTQIFFL
jgi:hypothetical protein